MLTDAKFPTPCVDCDSTDKPTGAARCDFCAEWNHVLTVDIPLSSLVLIDNEDVATHWDGVNYVCENPF